jgi:3-hydroxyisobutyrate dehydrogenase-like beta-hydroxyacid dehydrogenase
MKIAMIGLGKMGANMTTRLLRAGLVEPFRPTALTTSCSS